MTTLHCDPAAAAELDDVPAMREAAPASLDDAPWERSARASQRITALGEMTAGLAHDFRNILAIIESGLNLAERNRDDPDKAQAALAAAHEGIRRGMRLTSQLVLFARPGKPDVHPANINDLLDGLKAFLKYGAGPGIRVVLDLAPELPKCRIDPPRFNAAILNLVINARDAMPDGGEIRIETHECEPLAGDAAAPPRRCVRVRIKDQGCGMPPEVARHLFDPYFTTKGEAGTGLGVPQVAAFMRACGGHVSVSTAPGAGTTFDLLFPCAQSRASMERDLWSQLDRWVNEGGRFDPIAGPADGAREIEEPNNRSTAPASLPVAPSPPIRPEDDLPGTNPVGRDQ
jgi:signal transduction histidine kinase